MIFLNTTVFRAVSVSKGLTASGCLRNGYFKSEKIALRASYSLFDNSRKRKRFVFGIKSVPF